ncbi:hypothetical protein HYV49_00560 [Candidatus Pacearchaeota archaeon]|nr:hypothetical protein [Candidatus Pacearchaeota archaeon]
MEEENLEEKELEEENKEVNSNKSKDKIKRYKDNYKTPKKLRYSRGKLY